MTQTQTGEGMHSTQRSDVSIRRINRQDTSVATNATQTRGLLWWFSPPPPLMWLQITSSILRWEFDIAALRQNLISAGIFKTATRLLKKLLVCACNLCKKGDAKQNPPSLGKRRAILRRAPSVSQPCQPQICCACKQHCLNVELEV